MKVLRVLTALVLASGFTFAWTLSNAGGQDYYGNEDPNKKILKQGLLGAGTGAIASGASGGNAGKGALIGAGTNVIGGALLDSLTSSPAPAPQPQPVYYQQSAPQTQYVQQQSYPVQQPVQQVQRVEYAPQPVYYQQAAPQPDPNQKILKSALLGAGTGAIAASASGGKAGTGALVGAGTNVIGGALLDSLTSSPQPAPQPVYYQQAPPQQYQYQQQPQQGYTSNGTQPKKKIIRKYDSDGNVVSEEEVWE